MEKYRAVIHRLPRFMPPEALVRPSLPRVVDGGFLSSLALLRDLACCAVVGLFDHAMRCALRLLTGARRDSRVAAAWPQNAPVLARRADAAFGQDLRGHVINSFRLPHGAREEQVCPHFGVIDPARHGEVSLHRMASRCAAVTALTAGFALLDPQGLDHPVIAVSSPDFSAVDASRSFSPLFIPAASSGSAGKVVRAWTCRGVGPAIRGLRAASDAGILRSRAGGSAVAHRCAIGPGDDGDGLRPAANGHQPQAEWSGRDNVRICHRPVTSIESRRRHAFGMTTGEMLDGRLPPGNVGTTGGALDVILDGERRHGPPSWRHQVQARWTTLRAQGWRWCAWRRAFPRPRCWQAWRPGVSTAGPGAPTAPPGRWTLRLWTDNPGACVMAERGDDSLPGFRSGGRMSWLDAPRRTPSGH